MFKNRAIRQLVLALGIASMVATVHGAWFAAPDADASASAAIARVRFSVWDSAQRAWSSKYLTNGETILGAEGDVIELKPEGAGTVTSIPSYLVAISLDAPPQSACETLETACTIPAPNPVALAAAGTAFYGRLALSRPVYVAGNVGAEVVAVGTPGVNELSAADQGGSVGVNAVTLNVGADAISFTWDISRWARGDVFVGLNYAAYKVLDRHGTFKRYLASSDYGRRDKYHGIGGYDGTVGEATTGCAANWRTGEIFLTNFDDVEPAVNVITRQPGSGADYPYPYANQARRVSTAIFRSQDPNDLTWVYPIDTSPESIVFDGSENMYVGHSGPYFSTADYSILDPNLNKVFDAVLAYSFVDELGAEVLARQLGTSGAGTRITHDPAMFSRLDTDANGGVQFNAQRTFTWGTGPGESAPLTLAKTVWEDVAANLALENAAVPGVALAARPILGKRLHKYNYTGVPTAPYSGASRNLHWPFTNRQGTDWIDLAADQNTMFYTSENSYIHRYNTATGLQMADFGTGQRRQLGQPGQVFHALRILPPGDGTGGVIVAAGTQILRLNGDGQLIQYYQAVGDPDVVANGNAGGLVGSWYSLEVDPSGRTFWASGHDTGYLYQFDLATGARLKRVQAVNFLPLNDPAAPFGRRVEGLCIMWEYTAAQEVCFDGVDNDGDGFVDESCTAIESCSVSSPGNDDGDAFADHNDPDCGEERPPVAVDDSYVTNQGVQLSVPASGVLSNDSDPDNVDADPLNNDPLTVQEVGTNAGALGAGNVGAVNYPTAQGGTVTVSSDGAFTYTPVAGFHGRDTFMYRAFDGAGLSNSVTVTIRVRPLVANDSYTILQGATLSVGGTDVSPAGILVNDSVGPVLAVAATLTTANGAAVAILENGNFTYQPPATFAGVDTFVYRGKDSESESEATATVTITVQDVNELSAADDAVDTPHGTPATVNVKGNDRDPESHTFRVKKVNGQAIATGQSLSVTNATVTLDADGRLVVTPATGYTGAVTFTYEIEDNPASPMLPVTSNASVRVTVGPPSIGGTDDAYTTPQNTLLIVGTRPGDPPGVLANDVGVATLTVYTAGISPTLSALGAGWATFDTGEGGRVNLRPDGGFTYEPRLHFIGVDRFNYTLINQQGTPSSVVAVTLTVTATSSAAVATTPNPSVYGTVVPVTATIRCGALLTPSVGTVTFRDGATILASGVAVVNGIATTTLPASVVVGNHTITAEYSGVTGVCPAAEGSTTHRVTPAALTVTAENKTKIYGAAMPALTSGITGFVAGDTAAVVTGTAALNTAATSATGVGSYAITAAVGTLAAQNYTFTFVNATLTVTPAGLTVTADNKTRAYGAANPTLTSTFSGFVNGDDAGVVSGAAALSTTAATASPVSSYTIAATAGSLSASNYTFTPVNGVLTVTPAVLTVRADDKSRNYGAPNPDLTASITGFAAGDTAAVVTGAAALSTAAVPTSPAGPYPIVVSQDTLATTPNYTFALVNGTLTVVNNLPVAANDTAETPEDTEIRGDAAFNDTPSADGGNVWSLVTGASHGTVQVAADGSFLYVPAANYNGTDSFTYRLTDANGDVATATVTVTITPADDLPHAVDDAFTTDEDTAVNSSLTGNDTSADGGNVWSLATGAGHGTVQVIADGSFTYTPTANFHGTDTFTYTLTDADGDVSTATVTVTITAVDDLPVAVSDAVTTFEDTEASGSLTANDTASGDGSNVWSLATGASHGTAVVHGNGTYSYTPAANFHGTDTFTYTLTDADGDFSTATVTVTIASVDDLPVAFDDAVSTNEDTPMGGDLAHNDTESGDGGNVWSLATGASHGTVQVAAAGTFSYSPAADYNGTDSFTYTLTDADGDVSTATVTIAIAAVNLPLAVNDTVTTTEDTAVSGDLSTNDRPSADGGNVWSLATGASHGTAVVTGGVTGGAFTYTPNANHNGTDSFTYTLTDANGDVSTATVTVTITGVDDHPVAVNDAVTTAEDTAVSGSLTGNDTPSGDGGNVWSLVTGASHGTAVVHADGTFTYTPAANYTGTDSFTYRLRDADGDVSPATVTVTITPVNDPPVAVDDATTTTGQVPVSISVLANDSDPDGDTLTVLSFTQPTGGTVTGSGGVLTFVANPGFSGPATFTYTIVDASGVTRTATVVVTVGVAGGNYRTQTQGGWGSVPSGDNPGAFLAANFAQVFTAGYVQVGAGTCEDDDNEEDCGYRLRFTSAAAVERFLPQGGKAAKLKANGQNVTTSAAGVFAGQVLALRISVSFSNAGVTRFGLGDLTVQSGKMAGKTVAQVLAAANKALGGGSLPSGVSISDLNAIVDKINNNFVDGTTDNGYVR